MDRSAECKCPCHTGGAMHVMECQCYRSDPVLDEESGTKPSDQDLFDNCSCTTRHTDPQCTLHKQTQKYRMGALPPPDMEWQKDKTPTEIACIDMLMHVRSVLTLTDPSISALDKLVKQIDGTLRYVKVKP